MPAADEAEQPALRLENVSASYGRHEVLHSVSLSVAAHECLALVGESGSGKTTVARAIAGLHRDWTGTIALGGTELPRAARQRSGEARRRINYIFQNPYGSLNPRQTIGQIIGQPLRVFGTASGREADRRIGGDARAGVADRGVRPALPGPALRRRAGRFRLRVCEWLPWLQSRPFPAFGNPSG